jgi:hypothetical protein
MADTKQPAAKRRHAQETAGSRTAEGKAASRVEALKPGVHANTVIPFEESAEGLAHLAAEYHEHHLPANAAEFDLVETLVKNEWSLRRLRRTEAEIWEQVSDKLLAEKGPGGVVTSGETFAAASGQFVRHQRAVEACERNYHRALKELRRLKAPPQSGPGQSKTASGRGSLLQFPQPPGAQNRDR